MGRVCEMIPLLFGFHLATHVVFIVYSLTSLSASDPAAQRKAMLKSSGTMQMRICRQIPRVLGPSVWGRNSSDGAVSVTLQCGVIDPISVSNDDESSDFVHDEAPANKGKGIMDTSQSAWIHLVQGAWSHRLALPKPAPALRHRS